MLQWGQLVFLSRQQVQLEHFEERVSVLGRELNCKVKVVLGIFEVGVTVLRVVSHRNSGTFAPHLSTLGNLSESLVESAECTIELLLCLAAGVLELD